VVSLFKPGAAQAASKNDPLEGIENYNLPVKAGASGIWPMYFCALSDMLRMPHKTFCRWGAGRTAGFLTGRGRECRMARGGNK